MPPHPLRSLVLSTLLAASGAAAEPWDVPLHGLLPGGGRLGIEVQPMTPELREFMKAPGDRGVLIVRVDPDRAGAAAGLRVGDVIVTADDDPVRVPFDLLRSLGRVPTGEGLVLRLIRDGDKHTLAVEPEGERQPWADPEAFGEWLGESLQRLGPELRERLDALERRLEELERRLDPSAGPPGRKT